MQSSTNIMLKQIQDYNKDKKEFEKIKFLHGGSSALLAALGKQTQFTNYKENKTITATVPYAIIPTGQLRKKYGIYPFSGELRNGTFNSSQHRKKGINYDCISGMDIDEHGMNVVTGYASGNYKSYYPIIIDTITTLEQYNYRISLKKLLMHATNIMLMESPDQQTATDYIELLKVEFDNLNKRYPKDSEIDRYAKKYIPRIANILQGKEIPFQANATFRNDIINQYPIVICSTVKGERFFEGVSDEIIYRGEMPLETVKVFFTPKRNMSILTGKLKELELNAKVYELPTIETKFALESKSAKSIEPSVKALGKLSKTLLKDDEFVLKKIKTFLSAYFRENKSEVYFEMASWMLNHASCSDSIFNDLGNYLYEMQQQNELLNAKYVADSNYFKLASQYLHKDLTLQHERLKKLAYFKGLVGLAEYGNQSIIDYTRPLSTKAAMLEKIIDDGRKISNLDNIYVQLSKLDGLYTILLTDKSNNPVIPKYIDELIQMVKSKYQQVYREYELERGVDYDLQNAEEHALYKKAIVDMPSASPLPKPFFNKKVLTEDKEVQDNSKHTDKQSCLIL